ncbi:hypothetical protein HI914_03773 [Erysiphe necator]|nr:hypothetical protein HI914_03773 [Erysiphe necator]
MERHESKCAGVSVYLSIVPGRTEEKRPHDDINNVKNIAKERSSRLFKVQQQTFTFIYPVHDVPWVMGSDNSAQHKTILFTRN